MPPPLSAEAAPEERASATFEFDPRAEGIDVPDGSTVFLMCDHTTPPWKPDPGFLMRGASGKYSLTAEFPAGPMEYKFFVNPPGSHGFWVPEGANRTREIASTGAAPETTGAPEGSSAVSSLRERIGGDVQSIFGSAHGLEGGDRKKQAEALHRGLATFGERLRERAETRDEEVRIFLRNDLHAEIDERHAQSIHERRDFTQETRNTLSTPEGRLRFRVNVFNELCEAETCGLKSKDQISGRLTETSFLQQAQKALGRYWPFFDRICSSYDGGNIARAFHGMADEVAKTIPEVAMEGSKKRARERFLLQQRMQRRITSETKDTHAEVMHAGKFAKFLAEGGDLAMKFMVAPALLASGHPILAFGAWNFRGFTEASGRDFGNAIEKASKVLLRLPGRAAKGLFKLLPEKWTSKSETLKSWLDEPSSPSFEKVGKASLPWSVRKKLFLRGLVPLPAIAEHIPYVKAVVAERPLRPGEAAAEQNAAAETAIQNACRTALKLPAISSPTPSVRSTPTTPRTTAKHVGHPPSTSASSPPPSAA